MAKSISELKDLIRDKIRNILRPGGVSNLTEADILDDIVSHISTLHTTGNAIFQGMITPTSDGPLTTQNGNLAFLSSIETAGEYVFTNFGNQTIQVNKDQVPAQIIIMRIGGVWDYQVLPVMSPGRVGDIEKALKEVSNNLETINLEIAVLSDTKVDQTTFEDLNDFFNVAEISSITELDAMHTTSDLGRRHLRLNRVEICLDVTRFNSYLYQTLTTAMILDDNGNLNASTGSLRRTYTYSRVYSGSTGWSKWQTSIVKEELEALIRPININDITNLDQCLTAGRYNVTYMSGGKYTMVMDVYANNSQTVQSLSTPLLISKAGAVVIPAEITKVNSYIRVWTNGVFSGWTSN